MKTFRKFFILGILTLALGGFAEPLFNLIGVSSVQTVSAQQGQNGSSSEVAQAGENVRSSVIQVALIIYNRLRWPLSFLGMVGTIGVAFWKKREGLGMIMTAGGFTFLWAFAPVVAKFFMGLAGVSDTTTISIN